jgi:hypothetical protein
MVHGAASRDRPSVGCDLIYGLSAAWRWHHNRTGPAVQIERRRRQEWRSIEVMRLVGVVHFCRFTNEHFHSAAFALFIALKAFHACSNTGRPGDK